MSYKLLISIVPHNSGEFISNTAKEAGSNGGTIIMGRGTAENSVLQLLGLGDTSKDLVYIIVPSENASNIFKEIVTACEEKKSHFGVLFTIDVDDLIKAGPIPAKSETQIINEKEANDMENTYQMINVIVNKGYAEDAMAAARKAGAGGGTIIGAKGTAREEDAAFFGMKIVPEKDMLMILVPTDKKDNIVNAITNLPCFSQAGSGIVFCSEAKNFTLLGKQ